MSEFAFAPGQATPRKRPVQDRSLETVTAIIDATFRVLHEVGDALTTTRVASVAGVSVGTLYQYFPNREALLHGALADHLEFAIAAIEEAAAGARGEPLAVATERVVRAFFAVKAARVHHSRALDQVFGVGKLDDRPAVAAALRRAQRAMAELLAGGGAPGPDVDRRAGLACAALEGILRAALADEDGAAKIADPAWVGAVVQICVRAVTDAEGARAV